MSPTTPTATLSPADLADLVPKRAAPQEHRATCLTELASRINPSADLRCFRAGCDAKAKWLTIGRGTVCAWCRSHGSGSADLRQVPAGQFLAAPYGTLDYLLDAAGMQTVRTLVLFCIRQGLLSTERKAAIPAE